jgi:hypothetical protein
VKRFTLAIALATLLAVGCGGGPDKGPVLPVPPPQSVQGLTFLLVPAKGREPWSASTNDALQVGFIKAGYKVTTDEHDAHDATIVVEITATEKPSFMTIVKNGQRQVDYVVHVNLTVKDPTGVVDMETSEFVANSGQADASDGLAAVNGLSDAIRFKVWAMKLVASRAPATADSASPGSAPDHSSY